MLETSRDTTPLVGRVDLGEGCWLCHEPAWLASPAADELLAALRVQLVWEQRAIVLFGREIMQPRLVAWAGDLPYRYSGRTLPPRTPPPALEAMMRRVTEATGEAFNHVLANRYRDGRDSMGMHSDDETELGRDPTVASLSLGGARRFAFATKEAPRCRRTIVLEHGALLVMAGRFQHVYRHGLPKVKTHVDERISLTFRRVLRPPG